jgi:hypothetical protein
MKHAEAAGVRKWSETAKTGIDIWTTLSELSARLLRCNTSDIRGQPAARLRLFVALRSPERITLAAIRAQRKLQSGIAENLGTQATDDDFNPVLVVLFRQQA